MSERWEKSLQRWYETQPTANIEYLDLANLSKVTNHHIANNLALNIDKTVSSARYLAKQTNKIQEKQAFLESQITKNHTHLLEIVQKQSDDLEEVKQSQRQLSKHVRQLDEAIIHQKPLTKVEVRTLVEEIAKQPKLVEKEALRLTKDLERQIAEVKRAVSNLKEFIAS